MTCNFCLYMEISPEHIVYEDEDFISYIEGMEGVCMIVPKEHVSNIEGADWSKRLLSLIGYMSQSIKDAVSAVEVKTETIPGEHVGIRLTPIGAAAGSDFQEKIMWNLRNSKWYDTLNS